MSKAIKFFSGNIPINCKTDCEVAVREDGVAFMRVWSHGKYKGWTAWWRANEIPEGVREYELPNVRLPDGNQNSEAPELVVRKIG
jgi:hypothetical protein